MTCQCYANVKMRKLITVVLQNDAFVESIKLGAQTIAYAVIVKIHNTISFSY